MTNFCTNCGNKLEKSDMFCTNCGTKRYDEKEMKVQQIFSELTKSGFFNRNLFTQNLKKHNLTTTEGDNIKKQIVKEIDNKTLTQDKVENRTNELIIEQENNKIYHAKQNIKFLEEYLETDEIKSKIEDCGISERQMLDLSEKLKNMLILNAYGNYNEGSIKSEVNISISKLCSKVKHEKRLAKVHKINNHPIEYVEDVLKKSNHNIELACFEKSHIMYTELKGSDIENERKLNNIAKEIISNHKNVGNYDFACQLTEDGGFSNRFLKQEVKKNADIRSNVFLKLMNNRLEMIGSEIRSQFLVNPGNRTLFYNEINNIVFQNEQIILNLQNKEKLKLSNYRLFTTETEFKNFSKLLNEAWLKFKENVNDENVSTNEKTKSELTDELVKIAELYEKGLLSEEEFTAMKKKLLGL